MSKKLVIVSVASLLLCIAFLGLAVLIGGDDLFHDARSLRSIKPLIDLATHKEWRWNGGDTLALDAPINIRYQSQGPRQISVSGPAELLQHVRVGGGRIGSDTSVARGGGKRLQAVISGVAIRKFVVNGGENLDLGAIDQPGLDLHINGNGTVRGHGQVMRLNLMISGPGKAELGGLSVDDAKVSILGSGTATLSPHGEVQLFIAGSGRLGLLTRPANLRQTILGSGEVSQMDARAGDAMMGMPPPQPPEPPQRVGSQPLQVEAQEGTRIGSVMVRGSRDIDLGHVEQQKLNVTVSDSGSATGEGQVDALNVSVLGSGHANLGRIAARKVTVMIMGSGSATVAPDEKLTVTIMGSGNVHVLGRPAKIERSIMGSGQIVEGH